MYPSLILDYLNAPVALYIAALNTGRLRDVALMEPWEQVITVTVGSQVCHDATRVVKNADDQIQCRLDPGTPVGYQNISINVAGERGRTCAPLICGPLMPRQHELAAAAYPLLPSCRPNRLLGR